MTLLGQKTEGINFTACSSFRPTLLQGQLCYSLNLITIDTKNTQAGKRAGLVLLIDSGEQGNEEPQKYMDDLENTLDLESSGVEDNSARIYLNTLSSFSSPRAGSYAMSALKKMTVTESFLKQTNEKKKCMIETLEDCQAKSHINKVQKKCGCVPWALSSTLASKVDC